MKGNAIGLTQEVAQYVGKTSYWNIAPEVIRAARGFVLDCLGVAVVGITEEGSMAGERKQ